MKDELVLCVEDEGFNDNQLTTPFEWCSRCQEKMQDDISATICEDCDRNARIHIVSQDLYLESICSKESIVTFLFVFCFIMVIVLGTMYQQSIYSPIKPKESLLPEIPKCHGLSVDAGGEDLRFYVKYQNKGVELCSMAGIRIKLNVETRLNVESKSEFMALPFIDGKTTNITKKLFTFPVVFNDEHKILSYRAEKEVIHTSGVLEIEGEKYQAEMFEMNITVTRTNMEYFGLDDDEEEEVPQPTVSNVDLEGATPVKCEDISVDATHDDLKKYLKERPELLHCFLEENQYFLEDEKFEAGFEELKKMVDGSLHEMEDKRTVTMNIVRDMVIDTFTIVFVNLNKIGSTKEGKEVTFAEKSMRIRKTARIQ